MKRIRKNAFGFFRMMAVCLLLAACTDEDDFRRVEEGLPISLRFSLTTPAPNEVTTRATDQQETKVEKLALFFYKTENDKPLVYQVPDVGTPAETTSTNYLYNIEVPESAGLTSGEWYLYAVANWDKGFWDKDMSIEGLAQMTKSEMDNYCIQKKYKTLDITETSILLTGKYGTSDGRVTLERTESNEGVNELQERIHLRRSIAKIIFNFKNGTGVTFTPETYDLYNYCRTSTLMERDGWTGGNLTDPGTLEWKGVNNDDNFTEGTDRPILDGSFMFYMPENVQKAKQSLTNKAMREKRDENNYDNFTYAPERGTYVVVHGKYEGPGEKSGETVAADVKYTIFLGDFSDKGSADNFTVRRNTKYTFNVTVNGVKNIIIEAKAEGEKQPNAEGDVIMADKENTVLLDAHFENRILKVKKSAVQNLTKYALQLKTPKSDVIDPDGTQNLSNEDIDWVHFGRPETYNTYKPYPENGSGLMTLQELLEAFKNGTYETKFVVSGDYVYIQAYVDEYYYTDLSLTKFINASNRVMTLASGTAVSPDKHSSYTNTPIFSIQQRSIKSMFNLSTNNPFGLETVEEQTKSFLNSSSSTSSVNDNGNGTDRNDGYANFKADIVNTRWDDYIDFVNNKMKPAYDYGLYQGLLRNRDENGNGIIDEGEIKWYLPAINQHQAIWAGVHALIQEARLTSGENYFTSTNGTYRTYWAKEGAFGAYKSGNEAEEFVRCIRSLSNATGETTRISDYDSNTRIITVSGLGDNAIRPSGSQTGEYLAHNQGAIENKLPEAFQVAEKNLTYSAPAKPGDDYVPEVPITKQTGNRTGNWLNYTYTVDVELSITRETGKKYYYATTETGKRTEITGNTLTGMQVTYKSPTYTDLYIFADNGNYVRIRTNTNRNPTASASSVVIDSNKPSSATVQSTFTREEIMTLDLCKNYSEEADGSDKGEWRIPNQRELMLMLTHISGLSDYTSARTYYDGKSSYDGMYYIQAGNPQFITTAVESHEFVIRPVRDAKPQSSTSTGYDSAFGNGGSIIK